MKLCAATITVLLVGLLEPCLSFPPAADGPLSNSPTASEHSIRDLTKGKHIPLREPIPTLEALDPLQCRLVLLALES
uniref:Male reproductive-related protein A n=1 Tax=Macrobrachium rosenbergii TaxID=79674 RepID=B8LG25_MACRS|nr:male reproductive-related protein A [Macrobrachium rosenbergii]